MAMLFRLVAGLIGSLALAVQYLLVAQDLGSLSLATWTVNFFSFFTILTNILVALALLIVAVAPESRTGLFFSRPTVRTAIAGYILIVGAVYFLVLRQTWNPQGWFKVVDEVLHYAMPALFILDWLVLVPKGQVPWKLVGASLLFPLAYMAWTLLHGFATNWYPYPFVDVTALGYREVLTNIAELSGGGAVVALVFVALDRTFGALRRSPAG